MVQPQESSNRAAELSWYFENFPRFCSLLDINSKGGERKPFGLNKVQRGYIAAATARDVILKPRQVGMTTLLLAWMVYHFLTFRGASVVIVCQSMTGNGPIGNLSATVRRYFHCLRRAGLDLNFSTEKAGEWAIKSRDATLRIVVAGASEASAVKVGRSGTVTHLMCTETAFWEYAEDTTNALFECVPSPEHGSQIVSESTANGAQGMFYRQCKAAASGASAYKLHFFPWYEATEYSTPLEPGEVIRASSDREERLISLGVTAEQIKWLRQKVADKGQDKTDQEYPSDPETCFLVSGRGFFDQSVTQQLIERASEPLERRDRDRISIWHRPVKGKRYLLSLDTSEGGGGDPSGGIMRDRDTGEHMATISGQYTPWELASAGVKLGLEYNTAQLAVERNNHGHAVIQSLQREHKYPQIYCHQDSKLGWPTNAVTRPTMLDALDDAHRRGLWKSNDRHVLAQFRTFVVSDTGKAEAARGEHDDLVMAEAIGWAVRQQRPRLFDALMQASNTTPPK